MPAATACRNTLRRNRSIENQDIVVWHSFGATHVCRPEDFPVMPVEYVGFTLKPNGFFAENPAMDLPPDRNSASRDNRGQGFMLRLTVRAFAFHFTKQGD